MRSVVSTVFVMVCDQRSPGAASPATTATSRCPGRRVRSRPRNSTRSRSAPTRRRRPPWIDITLIADVVVALGDVVDAVGRSAPVVRTPRPSDLPPRRWIAATAEHRQRPLDADTGRRSPDRAVLEVDGQRERRGAAVATELDRLRRVHLSAPRSSSPAELPDVRSRGPRPRTRRRRGRRGPRPAPPPTPRRSWRSGGRE